MPQLRVATLNLLNNEFGRWADREPLVIEQALAIDADVYAFQEVAAATDQVDRLRDALAPNGPYTAVPLANPDPKSIKSLAVVTRLAVTEHDACTTLEQGDIALRVGLETADATPVTVVTTHFVFSPTKEGSACRGRQAEQLLDWLGDEPGPSLVMGDFNSRPTGAAIAVMKARYQSAHEVANGREPDCTHPTPLVRALDVPKAYGIAKFPDDLRLGVDYIFVSPTVEVRACRVAWDVPSRTEPDLYPSDHFGLVADIVL